MVNDIILKDSSKGENVLIIGNKCFRCDHEWIPKGEDKVKCCPHCKSPYWDIPRKSKKKMRHMMTAIAKTSPEEDFYLCNQAVKPTEEKSVYQWEKVTCKNCLRLKK